MLSFPRLAAVAILLAAAAACSGGPRLGAAPATGNPGGTAGATTAVVIEGRKVFFDRNTYSPERLRELAGDDTDSEEGDWTFQTDCVDETTHLERDLALRDALQKTGIVIESLDISIEGDRRRLRRCLRRTEPEI
jgi:hypothetical protein